MTADRIGTPPARSRRGGVLHASAVADGGRALLILGRPGSGKSSLALDLIALGAGLIADDLVSLTVADGALIAAAPAEDPHLAGLIEARGVGILRAAQAAPAPVAFILDLDEVETERLPPPRRRRLHGVNAPLLRRPPRLSAAALIVALRHGGPIDPEAPLARRAASNHSALCSGATRATDGVFE